MNRKKSPRIKEKDLDSEWFKVKLFHSLPRNLKVQAAKLSHESFREILGSNEQELAENKDKYCSTPYAHLLAVEDDRVIGVTELFKREIEYNGKRIVLGGFGGMCTKKEKRKKGVATALLKKGMQDLKRQNCDIAFLNTDIKNSGLVKLYARAGFVPLGKRYTYLGKSGKRYTECNGMIAPVKSRVKFTHVMKGKGVLDIGIGNW